MKVTQVVKTVQLPGGPAVRIEQRVSHALNQHESSPYLLSLVITRLDKKRHECDARERRVNYGNLIQFLANFFTWRSLKDAQTN